MAKCKEECFITVKRASYQEDLVLISVYVPSNAASKYMRKN